jgi:hypothetical protein
MILGDSMATVYICDICGDPISETSAAVERVDIGVTRFHVEGVGMAGTATLNYHPGCYETTVEDKLKVENPAPLTKKK